MMRVGGRPGHMTLIMATTFIKFLGVAILIAKKMASH
jgi:hypothetical protein